MIALGLGLLAIDEGYTAAFEKMESFILNRAEAEAQDREVQSIRIDTHPGNIPMQRLLETSGYACCGIILIDLARETTKERIAYEKLADP